VQILDWYHLTESASGGWTAAKVVHGEGRPEAVEEHLRELVAAGNDDKDNTCAIPPSQKKRATPARSSVRNCQLCCDVDLGMPKMVLAQVPLTSYLKPVLLGRARRRGDRLQVGPFGEPVRRREPVDTGEADDGA